MMQKNHDRPLSGQQTLAWELPRRSPQAQREVRRNTALRHARTCYDHLAGVVGVALLDAMCTRGWLAMEMDEAAARPRYRLTPAGEVALRARGVNLAQTRNTRRCFAYGCLDWTERRSHLGGALGAAVLGALQRTGVIRRQARTRTVSVQQALESWLDFPAMSE